MYFIISLPRCGTGWIANFLTWGDSFCYHEGIYEHDDFNDYADMLENNSAKHVGDSDTGLVKLLPFLHKRFPDAKYVFVRRNMEDIRKSTIKAGFSTVQLKTLNDGLEWGLKYMNPLVVEFDDLFTDTQRIWDYIGLTDFPTERHNMLRDMKMDDSAKYTKPVNFLSLMRSAA
jgi:hypothetical protein